jgi:hypothetical protein
MAQHLWRGMVLMRICEVCGKHQFGENGDWQPHVDPICAGDDDDDGRRITRRRPNAPSLGTPSGTPLRVLEDA